MSTDLKHVKGMRELGLALREFPMSMKKQAIRGALRASAKPIHADVMANVPRNTGEYAKGIVITTKVTRGLLSVGKVITRGKHAYLGNWLEFTGAAPHEIAPQLRSGAQALHIGGEAGGFTADGLFFATAEHPGMAAKPHFRPAFDNQSGAAIAAFGAYLRRWLKRNKVFVPGAVTVEPLLKGDE